MNVLDVRYVSQIVPTANAHANDCGVASSLMLLRTYNLADTVTVDQFYDSIKPSGDYALSAGELQGRMAAYGLKNEWKIGVTLEQIFGYLRSRKPVLALIHYAPLVDAGITEKKTFRGAHFVVITGVDFDNVYINDPYRTDSKVNLAVPIGVFEKGWQECALDGNPVGGCIIPLLSIRDLSTPVPENDEYYITSNVNGLNVRAEPSQTSAWVRTIWRTSEPIVHVLMSTLTTDYVRLTDGTGWVWAGFLRKK